MLKSSGRRIDLSRAVRRRDAARGPLASTSSSRASVAAGRRSTSASSSLTPPASTSWSSSARCTPRAAAFLEASVASRARTSSSPGGTQAGKTTLLNCLAAAIPAGERVVSCEEVFELRFALARRGGHADARPQPRGPGRDPTAPISSRRALRMRPSRIVVGEVRAGGVPRPVARAQRRRTRACARSTPTRPARPSRSCARCRCSPARTSTTSFVVPTVAASIDIVVHAATGSRGRRRVREIVAVPGRVEGDVVEIAGLFSLREGQLRRDNGFPPHPERFDELGYDLGELLDPRLDRG